MINKRLGLIIWLVFTFCRNAETTPLKANNQSINSDLAYRSAVILQYHHVSAHTPPSTSVTPSQFEQHLKWLKNNQFQVMALPELITALKNKEKLSSDKVVAITFDDANVSVCETAWPILQREKIPFTLFINSDTVEKKYPSQCSWTALKQMAESGLMTPANHSHQHLNMISRQLLANPNQWQQTIRDEIILAKQLITLHLGSDNGLFAYPYGEYNQQLKSLVSELGYIGFGQQSGAVGIGSDFSALPRFPASATHANLDTLKVKLLSLAFPGTVSYAVDNPISVNSNNNPPWLTITPFDQSLLSATNCFNAHGQPLTTKIEDTLIKITPSAPLKRGRHKYTCTARSHLANRYYWFSHQWLIE